VLTVVERLELGGGQVCARGVEPSVVEPVHPLEGRELHVVEVAPRPASTDQLGLEQADLGLGERVS
jgi:hypothetical protein